METVSDLFHLFLEVLVLFIGDRHCEGSESVVDSITAELEYLAFVNFKQIGTSPEVRFHCLTVVAFVPLGGQLSPGQPGPGAQLSGAHLPLFGGGQLGPGQLGPNPIWYLQWYF